MKGFRMLLAVLALALTVYTVAVGVQHGWNLLPVFFGDIATRTWPGQFNLDFLCMLTLSALWVSWRHGFSPAGLGLGALALFGGAMFLTLYLLVVSWQVRGDARRLLLGRRASGTSLP